MNAAPAPERDTGALNLAWSAHFVAGLCAAGVAEIVASPGSRSTPLMLASLRHPALRCHVVLDERSAAWFALGLARASGRPVALLCTSGTAAANWLPAVVEASRALVPLILCTADRPPELQDWDANQTIDQTRLFGTHVRAYHAPGAPCAEVDPAWLQQLAAKVAMQSRWPLPGPVHVNLAFREPLLPAAPDCRLDFPESAPSCPSPASPPTLTPSATEISGLARHLDSPRGLILCGEGPYAEGFADAVTNLAARLAVPILAEPLSGLRFGPHALHHVCSRYACWLDAETLAVDWVLRFGRFPVTRRLQSSLARIPTQLLVDRFGRWPDPQHRTTRRLPGDEVAVCTALMTAITDKRDGTWADRLCAADAAAASPQPASLPPEATLISMLCRNLPEGTRLFCGNSLPIRDLDAWSGIGPRRLPIFANRGASGIDGNIATAAGIATQGPTLALLGDLTTQHDIASLAVVGDRPLTIVVLNNGGGGIFDLLPQAKLPEFETGWLTPQSLDFGLAAQAFGIPHCLTHDATATAAAACAAIAAGKPQLIELSIDRQQSLARRHAGT